ncbi:hypothetical protein M8J76_011304 [Diaphorina citri]|nr:hypothetical protein M8J76_011304 [Diaphorina citri]
MLNLDIFALRDLEFIAPMAIRAGEDLTLVCRYDLNNDTLYSIQWYFNHKQFFLHFPSLTPHSRVVPEMHIDVDLTRSNSSAVTLQNAPRELTGYYKCQVSADAPLFTTLEKSQLVIVAELPSDRPKIAIEKPKYGLDDLIRANCTSEGSDPAPNVTWYLNDNQLYGSDRIKINQTREMNEIGLESVTSYLTLQATPSVFINGKMALNCSVHMYNIYRETYSVHITEDTPHIAHVLGVNNQSSLPRIHSCLCYLLVILTLLISSQAGYL